MTINQVATRAGRSIANILTDEASIASASTTDLGSTQYQSISITGTTTITAFGSSAMTGAVKFIKFAGALTLTHNATSLILPGGANITTVAGDCATVRYEGSGNWRVMFYTAANGLSSGLTDPGADRLRAWDESANAEAWFAPSTGLTTSTTNLLIDKASDANVRAAASDKVLTSDLIESASAGVALSDAATVAVDWDTGVNFTLTVTANRVIGNPTNGQPGTWRTILVQGNDTTDRTITFDTQYLGEVPTITTCDSGVWFLLTIFCVSTSHFVVSSKRAKG